MNRRRLVGEDLTRNAINFGQRAAIHDIATGLTLTFTEFEQCVELDRSRSVAAPQHQARRSHGRAWEKRGRHAYPLLRGCPGRRRRVTFGDPSGRDEIALLVGKGECPPPDLDVDDLAPAYIMYTGGTTGAAKGVAQCQAGYVALAQNMLLSLAPQGIRRTDSWLMCASL
jgi:hypothetical protein